MEIIMSKNVDAYTYLMDIGKKERVTDQTRKFGRL